MSVFSARWVSPVASSNIHDNAAKNLKLGSSLHSVKLRGVCFWCSLSTLLSLPLGTPTISASEASTVEGIPSDNPCLGPHVFQVFCLYGRGKNLGLSCSPVRQGRHRLFLWVSPQEAIVCFFFFLGGGTVYSRNQCRPLILKAPPQAHHWSTYVILPEMF